MDKILLLMACPQFLRQMNYLLMISLMTGLSHPFLGLGPGALGIGKIAAFCLALGKNNKTYFVIHILVFFIIFKRTCIFIHVHTVLLEIHIRFHVLFYSNLSFFLPFFQFFLEESNWENLGSELGIKDTILHWEWGLISATNKADREPLMTMVHW